MHGKHKPLQPGVSANQKVKQGMGSRVRGGQGVTAARTVSPGVSPYNEFVLLLVLPGLLPVTTQTLGHWASAPR